MSSCRQDYAFPRAATVVTTLESTECTWNFVHRAGDQKPEIGPCEQLMSEARSTVELMNQPDLAHAVSSR